MVGNILVEHFILPNRLNAEHDLNFLNGNLSEICDNMFVLVRRDM